MNNKKNVVMFDDIDLQSDYMQIYEISLQQVYEYILKWGADKITVEYPDPYNEIYPNEKEEKYIKRIMLICKACNYSYKLTYQTGYYESGKTWIKLGAELTKNT